MGLTKEQRAEVVSEAVSWVSTKTPYKGWARIKGVGVDCGQLLAAVYTNVGHGNKDILDNLPTDYRIDVAQHRASTEYVELVMAHFREIPVGEVQAGDIVVFKLGLAYAHAGIVIEYPDKMVDAQLHGGVKIRPIHNQPKFRFAHKRFFTLKDEFCAQPKPVEAPKAEEKKEEEKK